MRDLGNFDRISPELMQSLADNNLFWWFRDRGIAVPNYRYVKELLSTYVWDEDENAWMSAQTTTYIEIGTHAEVEVVRVEGKIAYLADGTQAWASRLYRPDWLVKGEQALDDAADEHDTQDDVRYGGTL